MSYAAVMVYVEADETPEQRVRVAASLAEQFHATLIGISALAIPPPIVADGMVLDEFTDVDIELMKAKLADKGSWFRRIAGDNRRKLEWRTALDFPAKVVTRGARSADLVVIGREKASGGDHKALDPGEAILKMGRPTLVVPERVGSLRGEHIVIGWKDTREARRAVRDALPFLQHATRVTIVEACGPDEDRAPLGRLDDVARYLTHHRIKAGSCVMLERKGSCAAQLIQIAQEERAELLVTGAYGHSRLGEWAFGGMTRELLATSPICCLMSH
jgi:nucleotide-binding universal stress UspA family protein